MKMNFLEKFNLYKDTQHSQPASKIKHPSI